MSAGVPVRRFYTVVAIGAALGWTAGYFHGKTAEQLKADHLAMLQQERVLDVHTEVYGSLPRSYADSIDWLYDHTD